MLSRQFDSVHDSEFQNVYSTRHGSARVSPSGYLSNLAINHQERGEGHGTELMGQITAHADHIGKPLTLHARDDLHPWYRRMGFTTPAPEAFGLKGLTRPPKGGAST